MESTTVKVSVATRERLLRSLPIERLLDRVDRAPAGVVQQVAQVFRQIS